MWTICGGIATGSRPNSSDSRQRGTPMRAIEARSPPEPLRNLRSHGYQAGQSTLARPNLRTHRYEAARLAHNDDFEGCAHRAVGAGPHNHQFAGKAGLNRGDIPGRTRFASRPSPPLHHALPGDTASVKSPRPTRPRRRQLDIRLPVTRAHQPHSRRCRDPRRRGCDSTGRRDARDRVPRRLRPGFHSPS